MDYDVLILGGGLVGCSIAYELSKYNLNIALIEKNYDIADEIELNNTSIVFSGLENKDQFTSQLEVEGNYAIENIARKFNVPFKRKPSIIVSEDENYIDELYSNLSIYNKGKCRILDKQDISNIEPSLLKATKALYIENTAVISPYDLAISYGEIAFDNNVNFKLEEEVIDITKESKGFKVTTNKNKFSCRIVVNTTQRYDFSIDNLENSLETNCSSRKIKYFCANKDADIDYSNIIFNLGLQEDKIIFPGLDNETIGAIITHETIDNGTVLERFKDIITNINSNFIKTFYEGTYNENPYKIQFESEESAYIKISDKHYAIVTMVPAISRIVCENVINIMNCSIKKDFIDKRREFYRFRELSNEERNEIIKLNSQYGNIICNCEKVTEGEIIDSIRRPLGARTLEGVKRRTGAAFGRCQGSQCLNKILFILARETNRPLTTIVKDSKNSNVLLGRIKEFDTM